MCSLRREFLQISAKNVCKCERCSLYRPISVLFYSNFSLYFRTQSGTIFLCTVSSCAFKMKELASHLGGWSTLMRQSQGNLREGEHPILTMVSYTSKPLLSFAFHIPMTVKFWARSFSQCVHVYVW